MVTLNDLRNMVNEDLKIDQTELDVESVKTPQLHNKYLIMYMDEKLILGKHESDLNILRKEKWLYYTGKMSQEELDRRNWKPFDLVVLKSDIDKFLNSDEDVIKMSNKVLFQQEKVNYLENVIKIVNNRQWYIRSVIDWIKFTNGT